MLPILKMSRDALHRRRRLLPTRRGVRWRAPGASQKMIADRIAPERAALERATQQRIAAERVSAQQQLETNPFTVLRRAEALASSGSVDEANTTYLRLLNAPDASRDTVAAV